MSPRISTRRKVSSLAQLSGSKVPQRQPPTPKTGQKRKLQPELKDRAETFLNAASISTSAMTENGKKRKKSSVKESAQEPETPKTPSPRKTTHVDNPQRKAQNDKNSPSKPPSPEKRLRTTRKKPPISYLEKLERAQTQRMIVLDRVRKDTEACPVEEISIVGTTGNIYKVIIV